MDRLTTIFLSFFMLITTIAASPPSFCKCTCFSNSTIIPLSNTAPSSTSSSSCLTCNKAFCLAQRLPICKDAEEKDVLTTCFQRDSRKDQIVVLTFIAGTLGLLAWAAVRKVVEQRREGVRIGEGMSTPVGSYAPVRRS
ncbi:uncharacterized protein RSE6_08930 [Rhynchosporium secalis]|uniref:Uncharacterized protein n=1 Tax=Rhynchosporium secalis TaxID=38038 RepID=A0A1E1MGT1_RHYSE|nr:uncharacterized protein RSE6_08930 [Rhynchosporium secalis]